MNAHVDYNGRCEYHFNSALMKDNEKGSFYENNKCEMVYENGRCSPVKCEATVLPPGACCPICGKYRNSSGADDDDRGDVMTIRTAGQVDLVTAVKKKIRFTVDVQF